MQGSIKLNTVAMDKTCYVWITWLECDYGVTYLYNATPT